MDFAIHMPWQETEVGKINAYLLRWHKFWAWSEKGGIMKNSFYYCLTLAFFLLSCNSGTTDSKKNAEEVNNASIDSMNKLPDASARAIPSKEDADFLVDAASGGMMEVQLGQLAQTNSQNQQVKAFGDLMVNDHGAGGEKLKALAMSKNITLPDSISSSQQKDKEKLQKKKGFEFDKAYINMMVDDHKKDIKEFQKAADKATDSDIKAFAAANLPMLYKHLDSIQQLKKRMGIKDLPMPVRTPPYE